MGNNSSSGLDDDQKKKVMLEISSVLDDMDPSDPAEKVLKDIKARAIFASLPPPKKAVARSFVNLPGNSNAHLLMTPSHAGDGGATRGRFDSDFVSSSSSSGFAAAGGGDVSSSVAELAEDDSLPVVGKVNRSQSMHISDEKRGGGGKGGDAAETPSPVSRANFRKRRLTFAQKRMRVLGTDLKDKQVFSAGEIGDAPKEKPPFPEGIVGTYSCHGIEPAFDEVDRSDIVVGKINQDRGCIAYPYGLDDRQALFAVYDGHGEEGNLVSEYCMREVQHRLEAHPDFLDDVEKAFTDVFLAVDESLKNAYPLGSDCPIDPVYSGTTAVVCLMRHNKLYLANCGDSRAVIAKKDRDGRIVASNLTIDQNPNLPAEQARIESMGGFVSPPPEEGLSARVWLDASFTQVGLAMGRSLGDHAVKPVGVIARPEVTTYEIGDSDVFAIMASDGVWEFIESDEAVDIVQRYIKHGAHKACEALIETAAQRWREFEGDYRDDITALVIQVQQLWDLKAADENLFDFE